MTTAYIPSIHVPFPDDEHTYRVVHQPRMLQAQLSFDRLQFVEACIGDERVPRLIGCRVAQVLATECGIHVRSKSVIDVDSGADELEHTLEGVGLDRQ